MRFRTTVLFLSLLVLAGCNFPAPGGTPQPEGVTPPPAGTATPTDSAPISPPTDPPAPTVTPPLPDHPIQVRTVEGVGEFYDTRTGETFIPRGVNYFWIYETGDGLQDRFFEVGTFDPERVAEDFALLRQHGFNTVRIFLDTCSSGRRCIGNLDAPGLNPEYLDNIAETMRQAKEAGIFLLLTSNDLPGQGGYWEMVDEAIGDDFGPYRNANFLSGPGVAATVKYWDDLMSGLAERHAAFDAVLGWSLLNEQWYFYTDPPFSLESGLITTANGQTYDVADPVQYRQMAVDGMLHYITEARDVILAYDPTALVTMGFFPPDYPNPIRQGDFRYVETAPLLEAAPLDFFDFHAYPGEDSLAPLAENFGMLGYEAKPIILGEVGAFIHHYFSIEAATRAIQGWIAESCQYGFDGFLYWGLYRAPEAIGDATWGFMDSDGALMRALGADSFPDMCDPELLPPTNLALGKPVRASGWLAEEPPEYAVDGEPTQWGAGDDAVQWIQIDLEQPATIELIRLVVAQWPEGETVHQVWGAGPGEELRLLHEFSGFTQQGDVLEFVPDTPIENIQTIRIVTIQSPSWVAWVEIEIYGATAE